MTFAIAIYNNHTGENKLYIVLGTDERDALMKALYEDCDNEFKNTPEMREWFDTLWKLETVEEISDEVVNSELNVSNIVKLN